MLARTLVQAGMDCVMAIGKQGHSVYGLSQWDVMLLTSSNVVSHWLSPYTEWSLVKGQRDYGRGGRGIDFYNHSSIHIHFRLRCCPCPILWGCIGSTRLCQTPVLHASLSSGSMPARPHLLTSARSTPARMPKSHRGDFCHHITLRPVASFTKEVNQQLAKRPLKTNGRLTNLELTSLVIEATGGCGDIKTVFPGRNTGLCLSKTGWYWSMLFSRLSCFDVKNERDIFSEHIG